MTVCGDSMDILLEKAIDEGICEIRWHGRGGQGAVSSAKILAAAAYSDRVQGVTSAPSFGAERRGAPVTASTRMSAKPIRIFSQSEQPHVVIVLDDTLIVSGRALDGLRPGGWVVVNTPKAPEELNIPATFSVATADANHAAEEVNLIVGGVPMVNTPMLGAVAKATGLVALDDVQHGIEHAFPPAAARKNFEAAKLLFKSTRCRAAAPVAE